MKIYKLNQGRVFTNYVENVSIISGNHLVKKASFQQINGLLKINKYVTLITIPCYNEYDYIFITLDSVNKQSQQHLDKTLV